MNNMQLELEAGNNDKYKVDGIWDNAIYARKLASRQLLELYYLVLWKDYLEEENTWDHTLVI